MLLWHAFRRPMLMGPLSMNGEVVLRSNGV